MDSNTALVISMVYLAIGAYTAYSFARAAPRVLKDESFLEEIPRTVSESELAMSALRVLVYIVALLLVLLWPASHLHHLYMDNLREDKLRK